MHPPHSPRRIGRATLVAALALGSTRCTYPATEVLVSLASDAPADRITTLRATLRTGDATTGAGGAHAWTLGGVSTDHLPLEFAATPSPGEARDDHVTLVIDLAMAAGANGEPPVAFRRLVRFQFTPRETTHLALFLLVACGATVTTGCPDGAASCTQEAACEAQGLTCGDHGVCVGADVLPVVGDAGRVGLDDVAPSPDAADAADATFVDTAPDRTVATCGTSGAPCCSHATCATGLLCGDDAVCALPFYATCSSSTDAGNPCAAGLANGTTVGASCVVTVDHAGGVCTARCTTDHDCPLAPAMVTAGPQVCFQAAPGLAYCLLRCDAAGTSCPAGQSCVTDPLDTTRTDHICIGQ